jgi:hypothetical protein
VQGQSILNWKHDSLASVIAARDVRQEIPEFLTNKGLQPLADSERRKGIEDTVDGS